VLAVVGVSFARGVGERYLVPLVPHGAGELRVSVPGDGAWRALAVAAAEGRTIPAIAPDGGGAADGEPGRVAGALVCRPAPGLASLVDGGAAGVAALAERPLGADQSNTSVVLGERLLVKAFRRVEPGLNPDLELTAWLSEEVGFGAAPRLAGFAELVTAEGAGTVALIEEFIADGADAYEVLAEQLTAWLLAPGTVTVEYATEIAGDLGALTAALHVALSARAEPDEFAPRPATRDEVRAWARDGLVQLDRAVEAVASVDASVAAELRTMAPAIAARLTVFEALPATPLLTRVHGDYHLGQVLATPDGFRIVDFEGEPLRPLEDRRRHGSPMRDVASMLRSLDHVGRSAGRRAERRNGGPLDSPGLDLEGWLGRSRERFLDTYRRGLREGGAVFEVDPALIDAFEIEKETYEFVYAATYLPSWLWAPTAGMRGLLAREPGP